MLQQKGGNSSQRQILKQSQVSMIAPGAQNNMSSNQARSSLDVNKQNLPVNQAYGGIQQKSRNNVLGGQFASQQNNGRGSANSFHGEYKAGAQFSTVSQKQPLAIKDVYSQQQLQQLH